MVLVALLFFHGVNTSYPYCMVLSVAQGRHEGRDEYFPSGLTCVDSSTIYLKYLEFPQQYLPIHSPQKSCNMQFSTHHLHLIWHVA